MRIFQPVNELSWNSQFSECNQLSSAKVVELLTSTSNRIHFISRTPLSKLQQSRSLKFENSKTLPSSSSLSLGQSPLVMGSRVQHTLITNPDWIQYEKLIFILLVNILFNFKIGSINFEHLLWCYIELYFVSNNTIIRKVFVSRNKTNRQLIEFLRFLFFLSITGLLLINMKNNMLIIKYS